MGWDAGEQLSTLFGFALQDGGSILAITLPHCVFDGISFFMLLDTLLAAYDGRDGKHYWCVARSLAAIISRVCSNRPRCIAHAQLVTLNEKSV